jgi:hypothetical protein
MPVLPGIMFLMYSFGRLVALVYIRRTLAGGWGGTRTDQGFYSLMVAAPVAPRNAQTAKAKGRRRVDKGNSDPTIEAGAPSTEEVAGVLSGLCPSHRG